jgi:hypothetical protein
MQRIYIDESGIHGNRHLVIGSLWVHDDALRELEERLEPILDAHFPNRRELKWTKISRSKLTGYLACIDAFRKTLGARFRCIVLDSSRIDYKKYSDGNADLGYYKFVYQLICQNILKDNQLFGSKDRYLVFHDIVSSSIRQHASLSELKRVLNASSKVVVSSAGYDPVRDIQPLDSKQSLPLQLTDILTGAVRHAFEAKGAYEASSPAKKAVIDHIQDTFSIPDLGNATTYGKEKFNIWEFRLRS